MGESRFQKLRKPTIVRCLGSKIKEWENIGSDIVIKPQRAHFDILSIRPQRVQLSFESKWEQICVVNIIPEEEMDNARRGLYRKLKNLEVELYWTGFLGRKPVFKVSSGLRSLQSVVKELAPCNYLVDVFGSNEALIELIKKTRPIEIFTVLNSAPPRSSFLGSSSNLTVNDIAEYYRKPVDISWIIILTHMLNALGPGYEKTVNNIFDLLDTMARILREETVKMNSDPQMKKAS